jgi:hypothetical protein
MKASSHTQAVRLLFNTTLFCVFLGVLAAFVRGRSPDVVAAGQALKGVVGGGVWAGLLVTVADSVVPRVAGLPRRVVLAAAFGAATYGGLLVAAATFGAVPVASSTFVAGAALGAAIHGLRSVRRGDDRDEGGEGGEGDDHAPVDERR